MPEEDIVECNPIEAHGNLDHYHLVDVREAFEMDGPLGHVGGSERIDRKALPERLEALRGKPLLFICRSGRRSANACQIARTHGFEDVTNLAGGMIAWLEAGLPAARTRATDSQAFADTLARWTSVFLQTPMASVLERWPALGPDASRENALDALNEVLEEVERQLRASGPPSDLDHSMTVFREDLAALGHPSAQTG